MSEVDVATAGGLLRAAREQQGLHIAALAAAIKISPRKLEALEADRHDELPDATFVRALAQTVCRTLKIDARPVLDLLPPAASVSLLPDRSGLRTPFHERPGRSEPGISAAHLRPSTWAAAALALAAAAVYFAPGRWWAEWLPPEALPETAVPTTATTTTPAAAPPITAAPAADAAPALSAAAGVAAPAELGASQPTAETVFVPPPPAPTAPAATEAAAGTAGLVQLRSSAASWVEVRDASGRLLLRRTVLAGESVALDGSLPMRLVIGNAAATQLGFRGQTVDLAAHTRDNVARVELQ